MPKSKLSIPVERRKATLRSQILSDRVKLHETKERITKNKDELRALQPPKKVED